MAKVLAYDNISDQKSTYFFCRISGLAYFSRNAASVAIPMRLLSGPESLGEKNGARILKVDCFFKKTRFKNGFSSLEKRERPKNGLKHHPP